MSIYESIEMVLEREPRLLCNCWSAVYLYPIYIATKKNLNAKKDITGWIFRDLMCIYCEEGGCCSSGSTPPLSKKGHLFPKFVCYFLVGRYCVQNKNLYDCTELVSLVSIQSLHLSNISTSVGVHGRTELTLTPTHFGIWEYDITHSRHTQNS